LEGWVGLRVWFGDGIKLTHYRDFSKGEERMTALIVLELDLIHLRRENSQKLHSFEYERRLDPLPC